MTGQAPDTDIAIIGGGASCVLLLAHLAAQGLAGPLSVSVFDRRGRFGRGIAYGTDNPLHFLNVRAGDMSALHHDKAHFANWAAGRGYEPLDFVPRATYGLYLDSVLGEAAQKLDERGVFLTFTQGHVASVKKDGDLFRIKTAHSVTTAGRVVLATGNAFPIVLEGAEALSAAEGYHADPWSIDYAEAARQEHVVILGTGLSMVDATVSLCGAGFAGKITAISRHGLMPAAHTGPCEYPAFLDPAAAPMTAYGVLHVVRQHVKLARAKGIPWQAVVNSMRAPSNDVWRALPETEKKKFKARLMPFWTIHRHRMPPPAAAVIQPLKDSGRLIIVKDRVLKVEQGLKVTGRRGEYDAPLVINCLGYTGGERLEGSERIGPPRWDELFETTAIPEIRTQAAALAESIAGSISR